MGMSKTEEAAEWFRQNFRDAQHLRQLREIRKLRRKLKMETSKTNQKEVANIYFHIGNGGISFSVLQSEATSEPIKCAATHKADIISKTPVLQVSAHHFGQQTNEMAFSVRPEALKALGEMLIEASKQVIFEGENQVVVENPRRITFGDQVRELGLPLVDQCAEAVGG